MGMFDIFSSDDARDAANDKILGLNAGWDKVNDQLTAGVNSANNYYGRALVPFQTLFDMGGKGVGAYADALGLSGADGNARAKAAFANNPGFTTQLDTGLRAIDRGAAARGMLTSGNTLAAEQKYGTDLANNSWSQYLSGFSPMFSLAGTGAAGIGSVNTAAAGTNYDAGKTKADYGWRQMTGIGDANAAADMANYNASANQFGALMGGVNMLSGMMGFNNGGLGKMIGVSDERVKDDVKKVGELAGGLTLYSFKYKDDDTRHVGVMAQEVEKVDPDAVVDVGGGLKGVDYGRVTDRAEKAAKKSSFSVFRGKRAA
jgi:hypothetical protein